MVAADWALESAGLILASAALRSRDSLGPVVSGAVWFFAHTVPWLPNGPTSIDFKPTDNPKTLEKLSKDPLMLHQARADMAYGLLESMDAAKVAAGRIKLPYNMLVGMGDRLVPQARCVRRSRSSAVRVRALQDDFPMPTAITCCCADKEGKVVFEDVVAWTRPRGGVVRRGRQPFAAGDRAPGDRSAAAARVWAPRPLLPSCSG